MSGKKASGEKDLPETTRREIKTRVTDLLVAMRELRPDKVMTKTAIAERLGLGKSAVSNWANMSSPITPSLGTLIRICNEYSVTLDYLVLGKQASQMLDGTMDAIRRAEMKRTRARTEPQSRERPRKVG